MPASLYSHTNAAKDSPEFPADGVLEAMPCDVMVAEFREASVEAALELTRIVTGSVDNEDMVNQQGAGFALCVRRF